MANLSQLSAALGTWPTEEQRRALWAKVGYDPTPTQEMIHFARDENGEDLRIKMTGGGERGGKSKWAEEELFSKHMWGGPRWNGADELLFWLLGPDYEQTRNEAKYLIKDLYAIGNILGDPSTPLNGQWTIQTVFPRATIVTKSAKDPETIAGNAPHGILAVEVGQMSYEAFLRCLGRIAETRGWVAFNGTFEGSIGWYPDYWRKWQGPNPEGGKSFSLPTWSNTRLFPDGFDDPEIQRLVATFPPDKFNERFGGRPMKPTGLVYAEFDTSVHTRFFRFGGLPLLDRLDQEMVVDPEWGITLFIDPGHDGYSVLWAIVHGDDVYIIDEVFTTGLITEQVVDICVNKSLWKHVKRLVGDIAAKQHHGSQSPKEIWEAKTGMTFHAKKYAVPDEILRVRSSLMVDPTIKRPHLLISPKAKRLTQEMQSLYKYPVDEMGMPTSNVPIPKENHSCTALAYGLLDAFGHVKGTKKRGFIGREAASWDM